MTDIRLGILGVGRIGAMHADLVQNRVDGATVTAVYDIYADGAATVGAAVGAEVATSPDALIGRRLQTRRDGWICDDLGAARLVRSAATPFAGPLDLGADPPRQNDANTV